MRLVGSTPWRTIASFVAAIPVIAPGHGAAQSTGEVRGWAGPLHGARISLLQDGELLAETHTDADGRFVLDAPAPPGALLQVTFMGYSLLAAPTAGAGHQILRPIPQAISADHFRSTAATPGVTRLTVRREDGLPLPENALVAVGEPLTIEVTPGSGCVLTDGVQVERGPHIMIIRLRTPELEQCVGAEPVVLLRTSFHAPGPAIVLVGGSNGALGRSFTVLR